MCSELENADCSRTALLLYEQGELQIFLISKTILFHLQETEGHFYFVHHLTATYHKIYPD